LEELREVCGIDCISGICFKSFNSLLKLLYTLFKFDLLPIGVLAPTKGIEFERSGYRIK